VTLTIAWLRRMGAVEELVVASDSRLRPFAWDAAPKIMILPRMDSVVAFAGATDYAYPMMIQMVNTVASWDAAASRAQPLEVTKGHLIRVLNRMVEEMHDVPHDLRENPDALFLVAGFSWKSQRFRIWTVHYDPGIGRFTFRPAMPWAGGNEAKAMALVGDNLDEAKLRLTGILKEKGTMASGGFDMEPIQVLGDMIDSDSYPTIGGQIQLVKVYRSLKAVPFVVERHGVRSFLGRPLLGYEKSDRFPQVSI
jgi:hypothetical protein